MRAEGMPTGWKLIPFGTLCDEIYRYPSYYGIEYVDAGIPEVRPELIDKSGKVSMCMEDYRYISKTTSARFPKTILSMGDLVMSVRGTIGKVAVIPEQLEGANMTANLLRIAPKRSTVFPKYLWYFMQSPYFKLRLDLISPTTTIKTIRVSDLRELEIPLPSLPVQNRIAAVLDKADALRRKRRRALDKLDELLQAVFLDMFGDPVTNPKGWQEVTVGDITKEVRDGPHVSPRYALKGIPFLSTRNIRPGRLVLDDLKFVSEDVYEELTAKFQPKRGDVLLTKGGTTGYAKAVDWDWKFAVWVHVAILRPTTDVRPFFLEAALNSPNCYAQSQRFTRGIGNQDLGLSRIKKIVMSLPPLDLQDRYCELRKKIYDARNREEMALQQTHEFFNALMQKAFKGELNFASESIATMEQEAENVASQLSLFG